MYKPVLQIVFCACYLLVTTVSFAQFKIPNKPERINEQTSVYDYVNLLSETEKLSLEQDLIRYSDSTSTQIVVAIINSTEGENILYLGTQWAHSWGIGQEKEDNGVFILVAKNDKEITINTGYGVEHLLTDALSRRIIELDILPAFKDGNYFLGLQNGAQSIYRVLSGEYQNTPKPKSSSSIPYGAIIIILFVVIVIALSISRNSRNNGGGKHGNRKTDSFDGLLEAIILSNIGRSGRRSGGGFGGFGGGGFGGGGFGGGFGGGGFGGGGASGGW